MKFTGIAENGVGASCAGIVAILAQIGDLVIKFSCRAYALWRICPISFAGEAGFSIDAGCTVVSARDAGTTLVNVRASIRGALAGGSSVFCRFSIKAGSTDGGAGADSAVGEAILAVSVQVVIEFLARAPTVYCYKSVSFTACTA